MAITFYLRVCLKQEEPLQTGISMKRKNRVRRKKGEPSQKSEKVRPNKPHYKRKER